MLNFRVVPYAAGGWSWDGLAYATADGSCLVEPIAHPMLEQLAATDGARTLLVVRERVARRMVADPAVRLMTPGEYDQALAQVLDWPVDFVVVECSEREPVRVTAGACRTTPLYVAYDGRALQGSWDMARLRPFVTGLNPREVTRLLMYCPRYSSDTVFAGIHRLTERATAVCGGALHLHYPEPALHEGPRELAPGADVLGAFTGAIDDALAVRPMDAAPTTLHLTGGFDSGTAALRAAYLRPGVFGTAALLIAGPGREQQIRRRKQIRAAAPFGTDDTLVDCLATLPFGEECARVRGEAISPYEEALHLPFTRLTHELADLGTCVLMTGLGGDEMVALSAEEHPGERMGGPGALVPWLGKRALAAAEFADDGIAPPAAVNSMTLLSLETTAPILLRHGIWPLHPFADPGMIQLGEWLPYDWRALKQLQRRQLASFGLGDDVVWPTERESFAEVVDQALATHGKRLLNRMLDDGSALFDEGLVDPDGLREAVDELGGDHYREGHHSKVVEVLTLDLAARAFLP